MPGQIHYKESLKRDVIFQIQSGKMTKEEARRAYGIKGHSTVLKWIRKFAEQDSYSYRFMDDNKSENKDLIKRIKELERQLEDEQIRSFGYSKMIDIAEEQLKVSIRKKLNTKQSKK